jgi:hypothetical protein
MEHPMTRREIEKRIERCDNEIKQALTLSTRPEHQGRDGLGVLLWEMDQRRERAQLMDELLARSVPFLEVA